MQRFLLRALAPGFHWVRQESLPSQSRGFVYYCVRVRRPIDRWEEAAIIVYEIYFNVMS